MQQTGDKNKQPIPAAGSKRGFDISASLRPRKSVVIFGAGIAGLTAAHELVERGFDVEVFEMQAPSLFEEECSIGGMARTQWSRAERPPGRYKEQPKQAMATTPLRLDLENALRAVTFEFAASQADPDPASHPGETLETLKKLLSDFEQAYGLIHVAVYGFRSPKEDTGLDKERAEKIVALMQQAQIENELRPMALGVGRADDWRLRDDERQIVTFAIIQDYIPGEHGFRFFPTFYRNLRDTMRRIPVAEDIEPYIETPRTVFDNIISTESQAINFEDRPRFVFPRKRVTSLQRLFELARRSFDASGFSLSDVTRLHLKIFKYMTSCPERRAEYERISWWDFVEGDRYSERFQKYLANTPQTLVAMSAKECDTRTYGNITVQLLRDHLEEGERVDATLNGPTSLVWLHPWRRYLEAQGVRFRRGKLVDLVKDSNGGDSKPLLRPLVELNPGEKPTELVSAYYVLAINIEAIREILEQRTDLNTEDFARIRHLQIDPPDKPSGLLRNLSGIQYYFPYDIKVLRGHTVYADAPWGLSSIAQPQFWTRKRGWWDGYRGLLSVGIGNWHENGNAVHKRKAWECKKDDIAEEVWKQIGKSTANNPAPILYHLDENIRFDGQETPKTNDTRLLINTPGTFKGRPGRIDGDNGYIMDYANLVLAGTYMQTFFRLTTMEAANESARHAVNAILSNEKIAADRCDVENPEFCEFEDLRFFLNLDAKLYEHKLPHFIDILEPQDISDAWLQGALDMQALERLRRALQ